MAGLYNAKYFINNPEEAESPGILYCVVLVNKTTFKRECLKIGITKGTSFRDIIKRGAGFKGYDFRILKTYSGSLKEVWELEQTLHNEFKHLKYIPNKFGGWTECFELSDEIVSAIPTKK